VRRGTGLMVSLTLAFGLCRSFAVSAPIVPIALTIPAFDVRAQVVQRLFGEVSDAGASLAASRGDGLGESPLRLFALRPSDLTLAPFPATDRFSALTLSLPEAAFSPFVTTIRFPRVRLASVSTFAPASGENVSSDASRSPAPLIAAYQSVDAIPSAAPASYRFNVGFGAPTNAVPLVTFSAVLSPVDDFSGIPGDTGASIPSDQANLAMPLHVGKVNFEGHVAGAQSERLPSTTLQDSAYAAGATFGLRAGNRHVALDVASGYEHLTRDDPSLSSASFDTTSSWQLSNANLPVLVPAYADVSKRTLSAGLDVPVTHGLTLNVQYDTQHLLGGYGAPGLMNLDAHNDVYGGKLTLAIPRTNGALSLSAKQYRYQDNIVPTNAYTQTTAGVNFTVKF